MSETIAGTVTLLKPAPRWFVHYAVEDRKLVSGPYAMDEAIAKRQEFAAMPTVRDAYLSDSA